VTKKPKTDDTITDQDLDTANAAIDQAEANSRAAKGLAPIEGAAEQELHDEIAELRERVAMAEASEQIAIDDAKRLQAERDRLLDKRVRPEFQGYKLNATGAAAGAAIGAAFSQLAAAVEAHVPAGRAKSLVATKLQEACMWAKRGIAEFPSNQAEQ
jgi:hypothetical protein